MADAFFRFGTDIEQTRRAIREGLNGIASDLAGTRGGNVHMFDGFVRAAEQAARKATAELGAVANQLHRNQQGLSISGGGVGFQDTYRRLRAEAVRDTTAAARQLGLSRSEIAQANTQVRTAIDALFRNIASQLAANQGLSRAAFLRGEVPGRGLETNQRIGRLPIPSDAVRQIARIEALGAKAPGDLLVRAAQLRRQEGLPSLTEAGTRGEASRIVKEFDEAFARDFKEATDVNRRFRARESRDLFLAGQEDRAYNERRRASLKEARVQEQRDLLERVAADASTRRLSGGRYISGGEVYRRAGEGLDLVTSPSLRRQAFQDNVRAIQAETEAHLKTVRQQSLYQSFLGGLTSAGFGGHSAGFDLTGLARSFGSTVKFTSQYQALQLIRNAFADTIREAVDYRDSLTDLQVAIGYGVKVNDAYVDSLSNISRFAGGNVGEALDAAARGIRAFTERTDSAAKKEAAGQESARLATQLSVITGQTIPDAMGDLVAIGQSFELPLNQLGQIADAVSAAKQQGGDPQQILQGTANAAVALKAAGFTVADSAQLMSAVIAQLHESGQAAATRLSRIVSAASGTAGRSFFRQLNIDPNQGAKESLLQLAGVYNTLNAAQQQQALRTLGGTTNLREFKAVLDTLQRDMDGFRNGFDTAGRGQAEFERRTTNLAGQLKILAGTVKNVQNELFDSGAFAPFLAALGALEPALQTLEEILKIFNRLADIVLPSFKIGGVGAKDVIVGTAELVGIYKLYARLQRTAAINTTELASVERQLTIAREAQVRLATEESAAERAALEAHSLAIPVLEAKRNAYLGLAAAETEAAAAATGFGAIGEAGAAGIVLPGAGVRRVAQSARGTLGQERSLAGFSFTFGRVAAWGTAVIVATQAAEAFKAALDRNTQSLAAERDAAAQLTTSTQPGSAVQSLLSAAKERDRASSGLFGNLQDDARKLWYGLFGQGNTFGVDAERDAKRLREEARNEQQRAKERQRQLQERQSSLTNRYSDVFGDVTSLDSLKAGLQELQDEGASASRVIHLLNQAFADLVRSAQRGYVSAGSQARLGDEIAGDVYGALTKTVGESLRNSGFNRNRKGASDLTENDVQTLAAGDKSLQGKLRPNIFHSLRHPSDFWTDQVAKLRESLVNQEIDNINKASQAKGLPQRDRKDVSIQAEARANLVNKALQKQAEDYINRHLSKLSIGNISNLQQKVSNTLESLLNQQLPEGGILTDQQVAEDAAKLADLLIGEEPGLAKDRANLIKQMQDIIDARTNRKNVTITPEVANYLQQLAIEQAGQAQQQVTALTQDPVAGARARLSALQSAIDLQKQFNEPVNDSLAAEQAAAYKALVDAIQERSTAMANALNGTTSLGAARAAVDNAKAAVQNTIYGTAAFWNAYGEYNKTLAALADAQVEQANAHRDAAVKPGDSVGQARAQYLDAQASYNAYKNIKYASPADFAPGGKYYKPPVLTPEQLGQQTGQDFSTGVKATDYYSLGVDVGQQVAGGFKAGALGGGPATPPPAVDTTPPGPTPIDPNDPRWDDPRWARAHQPAPPTPPPGVQTTPPPLDPAELDRRKKAAADAYQAYLDAQQQARESELQRQIAVLQAKIFPGSQIQEATAALRSAQLGLQTYKHGSTEWWNALGQLHQAQVQLSSAQLAAAKNRALLAIDITDPVAQARVETQAALAKLRADKKLGAPKEVLDADRVALRQAQASQESAQFQQRLQDAQTNEQLGRISHTAYINYLQHEHDRLNAIKHKTRQQIDELNQVDQLLQQANQQLQGQFNLGDIQMPTPYEVRRSIAAQSAGQSYQSNTTQVTNYLSISGADLVEVKALLVRLLGPTATQSTTTTTRKV